MDDIVKTELGLEVPPKPGEAWREHTAERWKRDDLASYQMCVALIRTGMVNQSELARLVAEHRGERGITKGVSRNSIHALMMSDEFKPGEIEEIIARASRIATAQALDKVVEVVDKVTKPKDLGAVAMALNTVHTVKQISGGKPTSIVERRDKFSLQDFEGLRQKARERVIEAKETAVAPLTLTEGGDLPAVEVIVEKEPAQQP